MDHATETDIRCFFRVCMQVPQSLEQSSGVCYTGDNFGNYLGFYNRILLRKLIHFWEVSFVGGVSNVSGVVGVCSLNIRGGDKAHHNWVIRHHLMYSGRIPREQITAVFLKMPIQVGVGGQRLQASSGSEIKGCGV